MDRESQRRKGNLNVIIIMCIDSHMTTMKTHTFNQERKLLLIKRESSTEGATMISIK